MLRHYIAFLVAPLWAPLIVEAVRNHDTIPAGAVEGDMTWLLLGACTVLAYAGTLLFGGVAYPILKSLRMVGPGAAIIVGAVAGPSTLILASIIDGLIEHPGATIHIVGDTDALILTGMVGMLVGMTIWLIGRTDSKGTPAIPSVPR